MAVSGRCLSMTDYQLHVTNKHCTLWTETILDYFGQFSLRKLILRLEGAMISRVVIQVQMYGS